MNPKINSSGPKKSHRSVWAGAAWIMTFLAITFGHKYAIDCAANPWAYGLLGSATPVGTWVGSATLNDGRPYRIKLVMTHMMNPKTEGFSGPDLIGESTACTPGLALGSTDLAADVSWTGKSIKLKTAFAANSVNPETACLLNGGSLDCTLFYQNKRSERMTKALKKIGVELAPKTVQVTFTRVHSGATTPALCQP